jgi:hypothetical protein
VGPLIFLKTQRGEAVAVINPADKLRFGEDSTPRIYANAKKAAEEAGLELRIAADEVAIGGFYARYVNGAVETPAGRYPAETWQWETLKALLLNYVANFKKPPDSRPLRPSYSPQASSSPTFTPHKHGTDLLLNIGYILVEVLKLQQVSCLPSTPLCTYGLLLNRLLNIFDPLQPPQVRTSQQASPPQA